MHEEAPPYAPWPRISSKIHKPKLKKRRLHPHVTTLPHAARGSIQHPLSSVEQHVSQRADIADRLDYSARQNHLLDHPVVHIGSSQNSASVSSPSFDARTPVSFHKTTRLTSSPTPPHFRTSRTRKEDTSLHASAQYGSTSNAASRANLARKRSMEGNNALRSPVEFGRSPRHSPPLIMQPSSSDGKLSSDFAKLTSTTDNRCTPPLEEKARAVRSGRAPLLSISAEIVAKSSVSDTLKISDDDVLKPEHLVKTSSAKVTNRPSSLESQPTCRPALAKPSKSPSTRSIQVYTSEDLTKKNPSSATRSERLDSYGTALTVPLRSQPMSPQDKRAPHLQSFKPLLPKSKGMADVETNHSNLPAPRAKPVSLDGSVEMIPSPKNKGDESLPDGLNGDKPSVAANVEAPQESATTRNRKNRPSLSSSKVSKPLAASMYSSLSDLECRVQPPAPALRKDRSTEHDKAFEQASEGTMDGKQRISKLKNVLRESKEAGVSLIDPSSVSSEKKYNTSSRVRNGQTGGLGEGKEDQSDEKKLKDHRALPQGAEQPATNRKSEERGNLAKEVNGKKKSSHADELRKQKVGRVEKKKKFHSARSLSPGEGCTKERKKETHPLGEELKEVKLGSMSKSFESMSLEKRMDQKDSFDDSSEFRLSKKEISNPVSNNTLEDTGAIHGNEPNFIQCLSKDAESTVGSRPYLEFCKVKSVQAIERNRAKSLEIDDKSRISSRIESLPHNHDLKAASKELSSPEKSKMDGARMKNNGETKFNVEKLKERQGTDSKTCVKAQTDEEDEKDVISPIGLKDEKTEKTGSHLDQFARSLNRNEFDGRDEKDTKSAMEIDDLSAAKAGVAQNKVASKLQSGKQALESVPAASEGMKMKPVQSANPNTQLNAVLLASHEEDFNKKRRTDGGVEIPSKLKEIKSPISTGNALDFVSLQSFRDMPGSSAPPRSQESKISICGDSQEQVALPCEFPTPTSDGNRHVSKILKATLPLGSSISTTPNHSVSMPVPLHVPTLTLLRSSPWPRNRHGGIEGKLNSLTSLLNQTSTSPPCTSSTTLTAEQEEKEKLRNNLLAQIHDLEGKIITTERKMANLKAAGPELLTEANKEALTPEESGTLTTELIKEKPMMSGASSSVQVKVEPHLVIHSSSADVKRDLKRSPHPMHAHLRLLMTQNQSVAAASHASLRSVCYNTTEGLEAKPIRNTSVPLLTAEALQHITAEIRRRKREAVERRRKLTREYVRLREAWSLRLKLMQDKGSKEKREAIRERDRYLLLSTRGQNALMTSKTSSGRTTTKIVPSVSWNGHSDGTSELNAILAEIEAEGGTPGSREIWSRTLAEVPNQDVNWRPCDCTSVLVENPVADWHASRAINPWMFHEKLIFLDKFLMYPKNFRKIASFLEHKSTRECAQFYFDNKLDLGIKQLLKESSTLKRKGTLRAQIVATARKRLSCDAGVVLAVTNGGLIQMTHAQEAVSMFLSDKEIQLRDVSRGVEQLHLNMEERGDWGVYPMKVSEKFLNEWRGVDLSGIDHASFMQAYRKHGTDWRAIGVMVGGIGKPSAQYREYYRQNCRRIIGKVYTKLMPSKESQNSGNKNREPGAGISLQNFSSKLSQIESAGNGELPIGQVGERNSTDFDRECRKDCDSKHHMKSDADRGNIQECIMDEGDGSLEESDVDYGTGGREKLKKLKDASGAKGVVKAVGVGDGGDIKELGNPN